MFDWNDEELTNIIWGEDGENDDHIVPYPDQIETKPPVLFGDATKKGANQQTSNISPPGQTKNSAKPEHGNELNSDAKHDIGKTAVEFGLDSWPDDGPDPSSSNTAKADLDSTSTAAAASNDITQSSKNGSLKDKTAHFDKDLGIFENLPEHGEQSDFVDYDWANIGSFDDLDRIFSNNDPIFGDISVGNADELWPSSKDISGSAPASTPLSGDSSDLPISALKTSIEQSEIKAQYMLDPGQSFTSGYDKMSDPSQDVQASIDTIENSGGKSNRLLEQKTFVMGEKNQTCCKQLNDGNAATHDEFPDKGNRPKKLSKGHKSSKKSETRQLHDISGTWSSPGRPLRKVNSSYPPPMVNQSPPLMLTQQIPLQRPGPFQANHFPGAPLASPLYGNAMNHYPIANASSSKNLEDGGVRPPAMTPKEKIEKLRRQQQMRAILAIQKQQMQFGNQASVPEHSSMEGGKVEDESLGSFSSLEPNSPIEQHYDSNTINTVLDNCSVEESVLYRLQDTISKMDMRIRLCIRDSLFRLAQSAMSRQSPNDTSSTSTSGRDEVGSKKDMVSHGRFTGMPDAETDTNPIDRTVAHLLFHRPLEFSGKPVENTRMMSPMESKRSPAVFSEGDQSKNGLCFVTSENAVNNENTDGGQTKETSK